MSEATHTPLPWKIRMWSKFDTVDGESSGSIFSEPREGHAYAVAICPRYQSKERWNEDAALIVTAVNERPAILARVSELEAVMARMAQGWDNAIELGLIPSQHVETAETLRDAARAASVPTTDRSALSKEPGQ